jgi:aromatic ring-opening dioxygenase LigB subunit
MLINATDYQGPLVMQAVGEHEPVTKCIDIGTEIRDFRDRVGLLVMADGSCRRDTKAPGYFDERAIAFDSEIERAIRSANLDALLGVDQKIAHELMAQGRSAWQVLASATHGQEYDTKILYSDDPFGVAYLVAFFLQRTSAAAV